MLKADYHTNCQNIDLRYDKALLIPTALAVLHTKVATELLVGGQHQTTPL